METHHIIPKCMGGLDTPENLVKLSEKHHLLAHYLLVKLFPENYKLRYAYNCMCNTRKVVLPTGDMVAEYEASKKKLAVRNKVNPPRKGKPCTKEHKEELSNIAKEWHKHNTHGMMGKVHREESKKLISINRANPEVFMFRHKDGRVVTATRREFITQTGCNPSNLSSLIKNRRKTVKSWELIKQ